MNRTTIYFIRHAEPDYNNHDDLRRELSAKGMRDRELVTQYLEDKNIDIVLSSPYKRAVDTVKDFADKKGMAVGIVDDFRERRVDSVWIADFEDFTRKQWRDFSFKLSDGESICEVQKRNVDALKKVLQCYRGKNIVVGSHGTALSTIINYFDTSYGYEEFDSIRFLMPWIVRFTFVEDTCTAICKINVFEDRQIIYAGKPV